MQRLFDQPTAEQQIEKEIKSVFYNALVNYVFDHGNFTRENLEQKLKEGIAHTMRGILENSKNCSGIRLPSGKVVSAANCPERYKQLFGILTQLKDQRVSDVALGAIAAKIMALPTFAEINPTQYLLELSGQADAQVDNIQYSEDGVTPQLIRTTFYNEMVTQAVLATEEKWLLLSVEDLVDQEGHIFWALPALTLLEAIQQSQRSNGIRLLDDKVVNNNNCPQVENFPLLVKTLLELKKNIKPLTEQEMFVIKHKISCERELPPELQAIAEKDSVKAVINAIKGMAIEISRKRVFCQMVDLVVRRCVEILQPEAAVPRP